MKDTSWDKPKRPKGPYMCFLSSFRRKMAEENPGKLLAQRDVCAAAGTAWAAMGLEEKAPFFIQSERSKGTWAAHLQESRKAVEKNPPPKRPKGAYLFFLEECRENWKLQYPGEKVQQRSLCAAAGKAWAVMGAEERGRYSRLSQASKAEWASHMHGTGRGKQGREKSPRKLQVAVKSESQGKAESGTASDSPVLSRGPSSPSTPPSCTAPGVIPKQWSLEPLSSPFQSEPGASSQHIGQSYALPPTSASSPGLPTLLGSLGLAHGAQLGSAACPLELASPPEAGKASPEGQPGCLLPPSPFLWSFEAGSPPALFQMQPCQQSHWEVQQYGTAGQLPEQQEGTGGLAQYGQDIPHLSPTQTWQNLSLLPEAHSLAHQNGADLLALCQQQQVQLRSGGSLPAGEPLLDSICSGSSLLALQRLSCPLPLDNAPLGTGSGALGPVTPFSSQDLTQLHPSFSSQFSKQLPPPAAAPETRGQQVPTEEPLNQSFDDLTLPAKANPVPSLVPQKQARQGEELNTAASLPSKDDLDLSLWLAPPLEGDGWQADIDDLLATLEHDVPMEGLEEHAVLAEVESGELDDALSSVLSFDSSS